MLENRKFFIFSEGSVAGPFLKEDVNSEIHKFKNPLVWARGLPEWLPPTKWQAAAENLNTLEENTRVQNERMWKLKVGTQELKPMTHSQMLEFLRSRKDLSEIKIWTEGYTDWKEIYQIHKIMDELGVSRRSHPRVPIMGTLHMEGTTGNHTAKALSISEGGLGITDSPEEAKIGEKFKVVLKSPNLYAPIHASVEVVYSGQDGYAGLKFFGLQSESKAAIIEYVRKFTEIKK